MKRDMDLARAILLEIEKKPMGAGYFELEIEGHEPDEVMYHVLLLAEAGLVEAYDMSKIGIKWLPRRLTWEGHEFLEAARDQNRWKQAKETMGKMGGFVFDIGKQILLELIKSELREKNLLS